MKRYVKGALIGVIGVLAGTLLVGKARNALSKAKSKPLRTNPELRKV
jgi:hypothetical protein